MKYQESLPPEYARIFAFDNFTRTQKHVFANALKMEQENMDDSVPASLYVRLHIKEVPAGIAHRLCEIAERSPLIASGLLQHESKMSVLHFRCVRRTNFPRSTFLVLGNSVVINLYQSLRLLLFCSVRKHDTYDAPIKAKEELIFHVGFRQFVARWYLVL